MKKTGSKAAEELESRLKYLQADFENYRKNLDKEKAEFEKSANESLVRELLAVIDDFERVLQNAKEDKPGLEMVFRNFTGILEKKGLKKIEALGKPFDPYYHEAMISEKSDRPEGTILEELQNGYMLNSKVIRHSKVKVAKK